MKLIDKIIDELSDSSCNLTEVLVKAKIVAHKLKNNELKSWIDSELNGYEDKSVPDYRELDCQVKGQISNGYQRVKNVNLPIYHLPEELRVSIQKMKVKQSVATLDKSINENEGGGLFVPIPPEFLSHLSEGLDNGVVVETARMDINQTLIVQCLTKIRTRLLDFMLNLKDEVGEREIESLSDPIYKDKVESLFNSAVFGDNTTVIVGNNNHQVVTNSIEKGRFDVLSDFLREKKVEESDIAELKGIIDNDNVDHERQVYGEKVQGWYSKMMNKAMNLSWQVSVGAAGSLLASALNGYYGWM